MKFVALDDFDGTIQDFLDGLGEFFSAISSVGEHVRHARQCVLMEGEALDGAFPVGDVGGRDMDEMRQPLRVHADMPLDSRYFLSSVVAFVFRRVRILHALRVNDQKACLLVPPKVLSDLAN